MIGSKPGFAQLLFKNAASIYTTIA